MYPGVELRLFRYVVTLAEELHFSRAAAKLHVAQPSLSKQIRNLEDELGVRFFERTRREVHLTRAGAAFVSQARKALLHSQLAVNAARAAQPPRQFCLGYSPGADVEMISTVRSICSAAFPHLTLCLRSALTSEQLPLIRSGELDAGIVLSPAEQPGIAVESLLREPLVVAMPARHPLGRSGTVRLRDLRALPLIVEPGKLHPQCCEQLHAAAARAGLPAGVLQEAATFEEAMATVSAGLGYAVTRAGYRRFHCEGVAFRELAEPALAVENGLAYRRGQRWALVEAVVSAFAHNKRASSSAALGGATPV